IAPFSAGFDPVADVDGSSDCHTPAITPAVHIWRSKGALASARGLQDEHPFHVPGHGHEVPLAPDVVYSSQQELPEAHDRFDDAKHRFWNLLAQCIKFPSLRRVQPVCHGLHRRWALRWWRHGDETCAQRRMM